MNGIDQRYPKYIQQRIQATEGYAIYNRLRRAYDVERKQAQADESNRKVLRRFGIELDDSRNNPT